MATTDTLVSILQNQQPEILTEWLEELSASGGRRDDLVSVDEIKQQMRDLLGAGPRSVGRDVPDALGFSLVDQSSTPSWKTKPTRYERRRR